MRQKREDSSDEGAILVLVLLFLLVIGGTISVVVTQATTSLSNTNVVRNNAVKVYTADAGVEAGIQLLRQDPTLCPNSAAMQQTITALSSTAIPSAAAPNPPTPSLTVTCQVEAGTSGGANGFAAITTDTASTDSLSTQGGSALPTVDGPVYAGNWLASGANAISLAVRGGNAYESPNGGACTPPGVAPAGLSVTPKPPFSFRCQNPMGAVSPLALGNAVPHVLPPYSTLTTRSIAPSVVGTCSLFLPGRYVALTPTALTLTADNYFASGVYYFENITINVSASAVGGSMSLVGGSPASFGNPSTREEVINRTAGSATSPCSSDGAAKLVDPTLDTTATGVTWILGGSSRVIVSPGDSQLELFSSKDAAGVAQPSLIAVPAGSTSYATSSVTYASGTPLFYEDSGASPQAALHELVWAPNAQIQFNNTTNTEGSRLGGGVVAGHLTLQNSSSANGFAISVRNQPTTRIVRVTATAGGLPAEGRSVVATAVVDIANNTTVATVLSWRSD